MKKMEIRYCKAASCVLRDIADRTFEEVQSRTGPTMTLMTLKKSSLYESTMSKTGDWAASMSIKMVLVR